MCGSNEGLHRLPFSHACETMRQPGGWLRTTMRVSPSGQSNLMFGDGFEQAMIRAVSVLAPVCRIKGLPAPRRLPFG